MFGSSINLKSDAEIALMREAGRLNAMTLEAVKAEIRPGVSTGELNEVAESFQRAHGVYSPFKNYDPGNGVPFPGSICASVNEEMVHGIPGKRKLQEGDIISVDCGTVYEGYVGDSAFTVGVGEISAEAQRLIDVTKMALEIATSLMVSGNRSGDVGADALGPWSHPVGDGVLVRRISAVVFPVREGSGPPRTKQLAKIEEALRMGPSVAE